MQIPPGSEKGDMQETIMNRVSLVGLLAQDSESDDSDSDRSDCEDDQEVKKSSFRTLNSFFSSRQVPVVEAKKKRRRKAKRGLPHARRAEEGLIASGGGWLSAITARFRCTSSNARHLAMLEKRQESIDSQRRDDGFRKKFYRIIWNRTSSDWTHMVS